MEPMNLFPRKDHKNLTINQKETHIQTYEPSGFKNLNVGLNM